MVKEMKSLDDLGSFEMIARPMGASILNSTWTFKKKSYQDELLKKHKSSFCVRGDQKIECLDVFDAYVPVFL